MYIKNVHFLGEAVKRCFCLEPSAEDHGLEVTHVALVQVLFLTGRGQVEEVKQAAVAENFECTGVCLCQHC